MVFCIFIDIIFIIWGALGIVSAIAYDLAIPGIVYTLMFILWSKNLIVDMNWD